MSDSDIRPAVLRREILFVCMLLGLSVVLALLPTGFEKPFYENSERVKVLVLETDNSGVQQLGIIKQGDQTVTIRVLAGRFRGTVLEAGNMLYGKLELDKMFAPGDRALAVLDLDASREKILYANLIDHYRISIELILFLAFTVLMLLYAGWTGAKALVSFLFTGVMIWRVLVPAFLWGLDPVLVSLALVTILSAAIIYLIGGFTLKGTVAFLGAFAGVLVTCALSLLFGSGFRIHGAVRPFSETLLYSGFPHLDLTKIFLAGIFLASSGAVMDLAMDIAASQREVLDKHPGISRKELIRSGFTVGRAVLGTMTTTLLFAYSGGFVTMLMIFMAQGVPMMNIFNLSYVSAEILHTLVGSFGLVTVAPLTAVIGGLLYRKSEPARSGTGSTRSETGSTRSETGSTRSETEREAASEPY